MRMEFDGSRDGSPVPYERNGASSHRRRSGKNVPVYNYFVGETLSARAAQGSANHRTDAERYAPKGVVSLK